MLDVNAMKNDVLMRCHDLHKLINGSANELTTLQQMSDTITTRQLEDVFQSVNSNTKYLVDASAAQERSSASLEIMQVRRHHHHHHTFSRGRTTKMLNPPPLYYYYYNLYR